MAEQKGRRGGRREGAGRKPIEPEQRRRNGVHLSLDDDEYNALLRAAAKQPVGAYVRDLLLRHLKRRRP